jgi:hypothetical protein
MCWQISWVIRSAASCVDFDNYYRSTKHTKGTK